MSEHDRSPAARPAGTATAADGIAAPGLVQAALLYSGLRLGLLVGLLGVLLLAGLPFPLAAVAALGVSAGASLLLLRRQRDQLAAALLVRRERSLARRRHEQAVREHVDAARRAQASPREP